PSRTHSFPTRRSSDLNPSKRSQIGPFRAFRSRSFRQRGPTRCIVGRDRTGEAAMSRIVARLFGGMELRAADGRELILDTRKAQADRKSTRLNSSHSQI